MASTASRKILFFTNSDYGQANVILATAYELMMREKGIEIHIASFAKLQRATLETNQFALENATGASPLPLVFHNLRGRSQFEAATGSDVDIFKAWDRPLTFINAARAMFCIDGIVQPWTPDEFTDIYQQCHVILKDVRPDLTIVEPLFTPGLTLCNYLGPRWVVLAPNTIKDFAIPVQPRLAALWKYPIVCSGMPFPLPASLIPTNIVLTLVAAYMLIMSQRVKKAEEFLHSKSGQKIPLMTANDLGVLRPAPEGLQILTANTPELDYDFDIMPAQIVPCGPIIRASADVGKVDPSLESWLARGPTMYVSLGSHLEMTPSEAVEMASAFRDFLDKTYQTKRFINQNLQILWKVKVKGLESKDSRMSSCVEQLGEEAYEGIRALLGNEMDRDQIRLTSWVTVEPGSVLASGHVICSVNHGGASSFNEALCSGIPQLVLPGWADCYDFANRTELLGIGRWGNKSAKPRWKKKELYECLVEILLGPRAESIQQRAKELAKKYPEYCGRRMAADVLLDALDGKSRL